MAPSGFATDDGDLPWLGDTCGELATSTSPDHLTCGGNTNGKGRLYATIVAAPYLYPIEQSLVKIVTFMTEVYLRRYALGCQF